MSEEYILSFIQEALSVLLYISLPLLLTILIVGLIISIFQSITQINENTLSFVPKLISAVIVFLICGSWMLNNIIHFIVRSIERIPTAIS